MLKVAGRAGFDPEMSLINWQPIGSGLLGVEKPGKSEPHGEEGIFSNFSVTTKGGKSTNEVGPGTVLDNTRGLAGGIQAAEKGHQEG
jgi:hypothetical protein